MNIENFSKRNISLYKLGLLELDNDEKKAYDFLMNNLCDLNIYYSERTPDVLYYGKSVTEFVLEYDIRDGCVLVSCSEIWSFFNRELSMTRDDIVSLILLWINIYLDLKARYISRCSWGRELMDEIALYLKPIK